MAATALKVGWQAHIAVDSLTAEDRRALEEAVSRLAGIPPTEWPSEIVDPLPDDQPLYFLRFTPDLRAFIVPTADGGVEVQGIVHRETLKWFNSLLANGDVAG